MSIAIKGAEVLSMEPSTEVKTITADILIKKDRIEAIGNSLDLSAAQNILDRKDKLDMPGLIAARGLDALRLSNPWCSNSKPAHGLFAHCTVRLRKLKEWLNFCNRRRL